LLPYFLLLPLMPASPPTSGRAPAPAIAVPCSILLRGLALMLISISTVASLTASDLREGLARLPVPRVVAAIVLQIVHQTATLLAETRQVASAMAVRGASTGFGTALRVLASLPQVWLPRIVVRAERVAGAMELRGYCDGELQSFRPARAALADAAALVLGVVVLAVAVGIRLWRIP
jgi:energy-coupling factor transporter transmembrane protein EcfT